MSQAPRPTVDLNEARLTEQAQAVQANLTRTGGPVGPYDVSADLKPLIDEMDLWGPIEHLKKFGYAVIPDIAPPEALDDLRAAIHKLAHGPVGIGIGRLAPKLLGRDPAIDRIATAPKILAFAEVSVGQGMRGSQFLGTIKEQGVGDTGGIHADQNWLPAPFPEHNVVLTFCVPCEGMTEEGGATRVVPGSHLLRRHPTPDELGSDTVAIEVEKGSVAVWDGAVWHGTGKRLIPGERTVLHATYQRLYAQPIDDYSHLLKDEEYMASAPAAMRSLLGADLFFGSSTNESLVDLNKFAVASLMSKL